MALARLELKVVQRSRGRSVTAAAAYRAGTRIADHRTGEVHDYRRRTGVVAVALFGPGGTIDGNRRDAVWNAAEVAERRRDSVVGREMILALPAELSAAERLDLAHDFAAHLARAEGVLVDLAVHAPSRHGDVRNHHAHLLFSTRVATLGDDGQVTFGAKTGVWDNKTTGGPHLLAWRKRFELVTNDHLARAGSTSRIDMRSLVTQGLARPPGRHDGPTVTRFRRELVSVRAQLARARTRLDNLVLASRLGADAGLVGAMAEAVRAAAQALRHGGDRGSEISAASRPHARPSLDR